MFSETYFDIFIEQHLQNIKIGLQYYEWKDLCIVLSKNPNITLNIIKKYEIHLYHCFYMSLSHNKYITPDILEYCKDKLNWNVVSRRNHAITDELLNKYKDRFKYHYMIQNKNLPFHLVNIEDFERLCSNSSLWNHISKNKHLPDWFIHKYHHKFNWVLLSKNPSLTINLIEKYIYCVHWDILSKNPNLTINFIEKHKDQLNWNFLARKINKELLEHFYKDWHLFCNSAFQNPMYYFFSNPNFQITDKIFDDISRKDHDYAYFSYINISKNTNLSPQIVKKYKHLLRDLPKNPLRLCHVLYEQYKDKLKWILISERLNLDKDISSLIQTYLC